MCTFLMLLGPFIHRIFDYDLNNVVCNCIVIFSFSLGSSKNISCTGQSEEYTCKTPLECSSVADICVEKGKSCVLQ